MSQYDLMFDLKIKVGHCDLFSWFSDFAILKTNWCINVIPLNNESVWLDALPQNKTVSLWPIFHGSVILPYILKAIWCINTKPLANESVWLDVWPQTKSGSLWSIFHGSLILAYILKTIWWIRHWHWPGVYVSLCSLAVIPEQVIFSPWGQLVLGIP